MFLFLLKHGQGLVLKRYGSGSVRDGASLTHQAPNLMHVHVSSIQQSDTAPKTHVACSQSPIGCIHGRSLGSSLGLRRGVGLAGRWWIVLFRPRQHQHHRQCPCRCSGQQAEHHPGVPPPMHRVKLYNQRTNFYKDSTTECG